METFRGEKMRPDVVVTGEAVALLVQPASLFLRVISGLIDIASAIVGMVLTGEVVALFYFFGPTDQLPINNYAQLMALSAATIAFWAFFYPMIVETLTHGRSLGKFVAGTRVVRDDGGSITFRHAFIRALVGVGEIWFTGGAVAILTATFNRRSRRVGDFFAGTYVISEPAVTHRQALLLAPELAGWAMVAHVKELDGAFSVMARRFLQTAGKMQPEARRQAALQIANELEPSVYPPPPPNTNPERFIAAVLVLRRDLEYETYMKRDANISQKVAAVSAPKYGV